MQKKAAVSAPCGTDLLESVLLPYERDNMPNEIEATLLESALTAQGYWYWDQYTDLIACTCPFLHSQRELTPYEQRLLSLAKKEVALGCKNLVKGEHNEIPDWCK